MRSDPGHPRADDAHGEAWRDLLVGQYGPALGHEAGLLEVHLHMGARDVHAAHHGRQPMEQVRIAHQRVDRRLARRDCGEQLVDDLVPYGRVLLSQRMRPGGTDLEGHAGGRLGRTETVHVPLQHPPVAAELDRACQKQAGVGLLQVPARLVRPQTREEAARRMRIAAD